MDDATLTSSDAAAMDRLILVLLLMMLAMMLAMMMVIHFLLRKEGSINDDARELKEMMREFCRRADQSSAVSKDLVVVTQRLLDAQLRLLDGGENAAGRVEVSSSSSAASDQQLMMDNAAVMKKKAAAAAKKKRNKRNKAAAKHKGTKIMSWLGGGIIPRIIIVVFGSITTLLVALSLIQKSDGSSEGKAPPTLPPSRITYLRQRDLQSSSMLSTSPNIMSPSPIPVGAQPPTPIFSPTAIERNALSKFYYSAGGPEWTDQGNKIDGSLWLDESINHCDWKGVDCYYDGDYDGFHVIKLQLSNNGLSGRLSESIGSLTVIKVLDLSDNDIKGSIPAEVGKLSNLEYLRLADNRLTGTIPSLFGNLAVLKELDLSNNHLDSSIPSELGMLDGSLTRLDLSNNALSGRIPSEIGQLQGASVLLKENRFYYSSATAPLSLCTLLSVEEFDLADDATLCPIERSALSYFYYSAKGAEWTDQGSNLGGSQWLDEYGSYCDWKGVTCDKDMKHVIEVNLSYNGLSGRLSESIGNLTFIKVLDLSDNGIEGSIPSTIGELKNLTYLRLCYNAFTGAVPESLGELSKLQLLQLQSNRITTMPNITRLDDSTHGQSTFVADCGEPSAFGKVFDCDNCTMCCNANDNCYPPEETQIAKWGLKDYSTFAIVCLACFVAFCFMVAIFLYLFNKRNNSRNHLSPEVEARLEEDDKSALSKICSDSVYSYFKTDNINGWLVVAALVTLGIQVAVLSFFTMASDEVEGFDTLYTWKCPRDNIWCNNTAEVGGFGWTVFCLLMIANLAKDWIGGCKLICHSAKIRRSLTLRSRIRCFVVGVCLCSITLFAVYASAVYSNIISTNTAELVVNSVIILFVMELDEKVFSALTAYNEKWTAHEAESEGTISDIKGKIESKIDEMEKEIALHKAQIASQRKEIGRKIDEMNEEIALQKDQNGAQQEEIMNQKKQMASKNDEIAMLREAVQKLQES